MIPFASALLSSMLLPPQAADSKRDVPVTQRAADVMTLRSGERLVGYMITQPPAEAVQILVRRECLRRTAPAFLKVKEQAEAETARLARLERRDRIQLWQKQRTEPPTLVAFIEQELRRVTDQIERAENEAAPPPTQLMLLAFPKYQVFSHYLQPADRRRILPLAWQHELANPEDRPAAILTRELEAKNVDWRATQADLSDRIALERETEDQWAARVALTEYAYLNMPQFHGSGGLLVRADGDAPRPDVSDLLASVLQRELAGLLDGNATNPRGADANAETIALRSAAADGFRGARITRLDQSLAASRVTVRARFLARMPNGSWQLVWQDSETADIRKVRPDQEQVLADDPQVAEALEIFKQLGLTPDQNTLATALRVGAATKIAQAAAETSFEEFLRPATLHLDSPLLLPAELSRLDGTKPGPAK
jgi:hypothetical protein